MTAKLIGRRGTFAEKRRREVAGGGVTVLRTASFETALVNTTTGYSGTSESSGSALNTRDTTLAFIGSASHKAAHSGYTGSGGGTGIIRGNWFEPASATVETDPIISIGQERWVGAAVYVRSGETHEWTGLLRWSDYVSPETIAKSLLEITLTNGNLEVNLSDYGGSATGVANRWAIHSTPLPRTDSWVYIELGAFVSEDTGLGWTELWVDGVQVGTRVTGRTIKLSSHSYRRIQFGMGTYGLATNGHVNPAASVNVDDCYLATGRRGPLGIPGSLIFAQNWDSETLATYTTAQTVGGMAYQKEPADSSVKVWDNGSKTSATWPDVPQGSKAVALTSSTTGTASSLTRAQLVYDPGFSGMGIGRDIYVKFRIGWPSDFPDRPDDGNWLAVAQWYASPFSTSPAAQFSVLNSSGGSTTYFRRTSPSGHHLWQVAVPRGEWRTVIWRVKFGRSAAEGGLEEIWLNGVKQTYLQTHPSQSNLTTTGQSLTNSNTTLNGPTMLADTTGPPAFYLQCYRPRTSPTNITMLYDDLRIGDTYNIVNV